METMKRKYIFTALALLLSIAAFGNHDASFHDENFNFGWRFHLGQAEGAEAADYDDSGWRELDLPHDFQMEEPWDKSAGGPRGFKPMATGWYRKAFTAPQEWHGRRVVLDFGGIMYLGDVWVNGTKVATTDYGYVGFEVDITKHLHLGGQNIVAVRASTGKKGGSRWYTGGGLYRDVTLSVKSPASFARHGLYVTTPRIESGAADVKVQVAFTGLGKQRGDVGVRARIFSPEGVEIAQTTAFAPKRDRRAEPELILPIITVEQPKLWDCDHPMLYRAEVELIAGDTVLDRQATEFGFRTLEWGADFGFRLNGKKLIIKSISNHNDLGAVGVAAYDAAIERQLRTMKAFGFNAIRCSHNPYSEGLLRLADKMGLLVVDELIDKWSDNSYWGGRRPFMQLWPGLLTEWVKRDRNHPSVILWSLGNELQMREDLCGYPTGDWGITTYRIMDTLLKRYDATRKTTVGMHPSRRGAIGKNDSRFNTDIFPPELAEVTEVSSFNYRWMDYEKYLQAAPHMIIFQSEASTRDLLSAYYGMDLDRMAGLSYWGAIEYWGESPGWPWKGWNHSFFSHALEPYPQAWLIKSAFSDEPTVRIGVIDSGDESAELNGQTVGGMKVFSYWNRPNGSTQSLYTYTNADEVELILNGRSLGRRRNDRTDIYHRNQILWDSIPYGHGGTVLAIARNGGKEVARHQIETAGEAVRLKAVVENNGTLRADGVGLQYIKVYAVDKKGRTVPVNGTDVTFRVDGEARLIALDNDDHTTGELFSGNHKALHRGFVMAILRTTRKAGNIAVNISAKGLKGANVRLRTI